MPGRPSELVIGWTRLDALLAEGLEDLAFRNWEEVEVTRDQIPLAIDWDHLRAQEKIGVYRAIGAHLGGDLVGYAGWFVNRHSRHKDHIFAINDVIWLAPEHRRGWNGVRLIREGERLLRGAGARRIEYGIRFTVPLGHHRGSLGDLLGHLGYSCTEETWTKTLEEGR